MVFLKQHIFSFDADFHKSVARRCFFHKTRRFAAPSITSPFGLMQVISLRFLVRSVCHQYIWFVSEMPVFHATAWRLGGEKTSRTLHRECKLIAGRIRKVQLVNQGVRQMTSTAKLFDLTGKAAIVTGASTGLGVTFAESLSAAGAKVALAARRTEKLESVAERIRKQGGSAVAIACDVGKPDQVRAMVAQSWEQIGRVDILVNNAGLVAEAGSVPERITDEMFEQTIRVNLLGLWTCSREVAARMLAEGKGGSIINIASTAGIGACKDFPSAYQASKAAVIGLTKNLACSWADRSVRVNAIAPGWFPSEMTAGVLALPPFMDWIKKSCPMHRTGDPKELVGPLLFLASDASSYVTGQTLVVDGGESATTGGTQFPDEIYAALGPNMQPIRPT
jgi:NAD(P)-dependent dehydrogenase (short-subunit alcohol dehydrogenase family)